MVISINRIEISSAWENRWFSLSDSVNPTLEDCRTINKTNLWKTELFMYIIMFEKGLVAPFTHYTFSRWGDGDGAHDSIIILD